MEIFKTIDDKLHKLETIEDGAWINLVSPSQQEIQELSKKLNIEEQSLMAALDTEERPRIEIEDNEILIIIDVPYIEKNPNTMSGVTYTTLPLGVIITDKNIITVATTEVSLLATFKTGAPKGFYTYKKTAFLLQMLYRNAANYLIYLRNIEKLSKEWETELYESQRNEEILALLELEKSLVYFSTSLKSNGSVLERLSRLRIMKQYPDDLELLEDAIIENKQAIEMAKIYSDVLSVVMDVFASVISNNFNILMKRLTSITIVMAVPTILSGIWGMNVNVPFSSNPFGFFSVILIIVITTVLLAIMLIKKKLL
ncbi:MAG: magnesium transporter CorA family protein [Fusobacteriaceae bacterium]